MEEATYNSGALTVQEVSAFAPSLDPAPKVIHIDLRSPSRNSYLGGKAWSTELWRELHFRVPSLRFLHLLPTLPTMDQLLNAMRTTPVGKTIDKDAHIQVYPATNLVHYPPRPHCDMVCLHDLCTGSPRAHSFFPFSWHLANPRW